jgi:hypothetical protein
MHTHAHTCTHMYTHVHTCTHMYTHVHTCTHMYTHVHTCTHMMLTHDAYTWCLHMMLTHMMLTHDAHTWCTHMMHTHAHTYTHAHTCTHMHTHAHTYTRTWEKYIIFNMSYSHFLFCYSFQSLHSFRIIFEIFEWTSYCTETHTQWRDIAQRVVIS